MDEKDSNHIKPYTRPAAGWGALKQVAITLHQERVSPANLKALLAQNQPDGFDCPGCAWPDSNHQSTFAFCENGAKAVAAEATSRRASPDLFASQTVTQLMAQSDYALEQYGRLTEPMVYDATSDRYASISWEDAYAMVGRHLRALPDPDQAAFYTSGRASNEAAFLYQLMARLYGTNNFPDCSNMCHEATSRGLPATVGIGKGTVTLDDFALPTPSSSLARIPPPTTRACWASCASAHAAAAPLFPSIPCANGACNASWIRKVRWKWRHWAARASLACSCSLPWAATWP